MAFHASRQTTVESGEEFSDYETCSTHAPDEHEDAAQPMSKKSQKTDFGWRSLRAILKLDGRQKSPPVDDAPVRLGVRLFLIHVLDLLYLVLF